MAQLTIAGETSAVMHKQKGFGYLVMLFIIAVLAVTLTTTYERRDTIVKREKEKQLLFVGSQYSEALTSYYNQSPNGFNELPKNIDELLKDNRFVAIKRHLRKRFVDPITGGDLGLVLDDEGRIAAVYSTSNDSILQTARFDSNNPANPTAGKVTPLVYSDVKFEYTNQGDSAKSEANTEEGEAQDGLENPLEENPLEENPLEENPLEENPLEENASFNEV
ncbi:MAG: type II secretion system protein [Methylophilaceae bacterium]